MENIQYLKQHLHHKFFPKSLLIIRVDVYGFNLISFICGPSSLCPVCKDGNFCQVCGFALMQEKLVRKLTVLVKESRLSVEHGARSLLVMFWMLVCLRILEGTF
jgi:hypothetical protein